MKPLAQALSEGLLASHVERDNPADLHVTHLGNCQLEAWAKRNEHPDLLPLSPEKILMFAVGRDIEDRVEQTLRPIYEAEGALFIHGGTLEADVDGIRIQGNPDFRISDSVNDKVRMLIADCKSTTFYPTVEKTGEFDRQGNEIKRRVRRPPEDPKPQYKIQGNAYASMELLDPANDVVQLDEVLYGNITVCRESFKFTDYGKTFKPNLEEFKAQVREAEAMTAPGAPMPAPEPPEWSYNTKTKESWMCGLCAFTACPRNTNPAALEIR